MLVQSYQKWLISHPSISSCKAHKLQEWLDADLIDLAISSDLQIFYHSEIDYRLHMRELVVRLEDFLASSGVC